MNTSKKTFGLLGEKLRHSYSPLIHSILAGYEYHLIELPPEGIEGFLTGGDFSGLNVTIPYKSAVIPFCGELSDTARNAGSVNTILRKNGILYGDNTDYDGFSYLLKSSGIDVKTKKVCVLGSGGSSKTVYNVLNDSGTGEIAVISRSGENNYNNLEKHADAEIIVNTTPVGMYPKNGSLPISLESFPACRGVIDLIYNPAKTALLLQAERLGIIYVNGLPMLTAQAKRSAELFTGLEIDDGKVDEITRKIARLMTNIVLIGMPGSGKSTLGQIIAEKTGRVLIDTDHLITEREGTTPAEIIETNGEETFRSVESVVIEDVGRSSGCVIATGGGVVTRKNNYDNMRQNGFIVFINRPPDFLADDNRPLSGDINTRRKLYEKRLPLYRELCDIEIDAGGSLADAADNLMSALKLSGYDTIKPTEHNVTYK